MRFSLFALFAPIAMVASTAFGGGLGDMTEAERQAFRAEVRAYLVENPEVLVEAMDELQRRSELVASERETQTLKDQAATIYSDPNSWVGGNPEGDITIVEFVDYRCGYCRKAHDEVAELVRSDGNIRFVVKEFPILGEDSIASSRFAIAVLQLHGDAAYKLAHDALITLRGAPTPETLARLAADQGLEPGPIMERMGQDQVTQVIAANHALGDLLDISGTPTFVIDRTLVRGYLPLDGMRQIVVDERG